MKVQILGKQAREVFNKTTGQIRIYTNLYFQTNFTSAEKDSGAVGYKVDKVNTGIDCSKINVGDLVNFDYGPTGYKNQDGTVQIRLLDIDVLEKAK